MNRFEFFKVGKNRTVGYDITFDESASMGAMSYLFALGFLMVVGGFLAMVIPSILFLIYLFTRKQNMWFVNLLGLLASTYFLLDYHFGWICYTILTDLFGNGSFNFLVSLNTGLLLLNGILLFHNIKTRNVQFNKDRDVSLDNVYYVIVLLAMCIFFSNTFLTNEKFITKYKEPIKTEEQLRIEHNQMY